MDYLFLLLFNFNYIVLFNQYSYTNITNFPSKSLLNNLSIVISNINLLIRVQLIIEIIFLSFIFRIKNER